MIDMFIALILSMAGIFKRIVNRGGKKGEKERKNKEFAMLFIKNNTLFRDRQPNFMLHIKMFKWLKSNMLLKIYPIKKKKTACTPY